METYNNKYELKNGDNLIVRMPVLGDEQKLIDQMKAVDCESKFLAREPGEFSFTLEQERDFISNMLKNDNNRLLIGEIDGKIVANCSVGIVSTSRRFRHRASLGIVVSKAYWRMGIGRIMMLECISWCMEKGVEQLELEVVTQNDQGIAMYKSLGFQMYGTKKHAMKYGDGSYADEHFMILFLNDCFTK